jgi:hypothetical protein
MREIVTPIRFAASFELIMFVGIKNAPDRSEAPKSQDPYPIAATISNASDEPSFLVSQLPTTIHES